MEETSTHNSQTSGKRLLSIIIALTYGLAILFWLALQWFHLSGIGSYIMQLVLYSLFMALAWYGMKRERMSTPVNGHLIAEAIAWSLIGWLIFVVLISSFGWVRLTDEWRTLVTGRVHLIALEIIGTWFFVGVGEELLFRGYIMKSFKRHFTRGIEWRRTASTIVVISLVFSLWHLPARLVSLWMGELDAASLVLNLLILFLLGLAFAWMYIRSNNILLVGLVHGLNNFPLIGKETNMTFMIILGAILCVELKRLITGRAENALQE
jgi:membrane protease YdiL (CAAX protease family)